MKINTKKNILNFILFFIIFVGVINLNLNRIVQFIVLSIGIMASMLLVDYFLKKKS